MLRLVLATLWRRRAQSALLVLLAAVAATGAATAPGYVTASLQSLAAASVVDASAKERTVEATYEEPIGDNLERDLTSFSQRVGRELDLTGFTAVSGAGMVAVLANELHQIAYRDDVCAHLTIDGACPRGPREVLLAEPMAARLGLAVGDTVALRGRTEIPPVPMTVVGRYRATDPNDPYWGIQAEGGERLADVGIFTPLATFASLRPNQLLLSVDLTATPAAYRDRDPQALTSAAEQGRLRLGAEGITVTSGLRGLADRLGSERQLVVNGVVIGVVELLVVCWLALFLAVGRTAETRRADIGLLKLRGARRRDLWRFVAGQSLLPLVAGGVVGYVLGPPVAARLAGPTDAGVADAGLANPVALTAAAVGIAVLGAAVAALAAERRTLTESVAALGRRVGRPRTGRLHLVLDAIVVVLALAGAYQVTAGAGQGVALVAPLLLALAVGVLAVRLAPIVAGRLGTNALRSGRLGATLAAYHLARRAGAASVLGVVVVTVAVGTATTLTWSQAASARAQRAALEVGAPRVLTVRAANPRQLLQAVRTADPSGRSAMAVVRTDTAAGPVLAVDAARLAAVAPRLDAYGLPDFAALAAALHPGGYEPVLVRADRLAVDATSTVEGRLVARLVAADGRPFAVSFGPLTNGRHAYAEAVACAAGCRLVSLSVVSTVDIAGAVTVHSVSNVDGVLADRTRWRAGVADAAAVPELTAGPDGLRIAPGRGTPAPELTAFVADAPTPLPVVRGGDIGVDRSQPRSAVLGPDVLPVRVAAAGARLPGADDGLLADLEYADRLGRADGEQSGSTSQVWLGADAPAGIDAALTAAGLAVLGERGIAGRQSELDARGPATALRFLVIVALVAIAMALLSFAVAGAAERRPRGAELAGLRRQGLPARVVRRVGLGGYPVLGLAAVAVGLVTGVLLVVAVPAPLPAFADAFVAPAPPTVPVLPLAGAALLCLLAFATVGLAAGAGLSAASAARSNAGGSAWSD